MPVERVDEFRDRMNRYAAARLTPDDFRPTREIDARIDFAEISDQTAEDVLSLEPFGFGNPAPLFVCERTTVAGKAKVFKEKHARLPVNQNGRVFWLKGWNLAERLTDFPPGSVVDVAFSFEDDAYSAARGYPGWNLVLKDIRSSE